jgi:hypothetical protein
MRKQLKLSSDGGDSGNKKFKRGYRDAFSGVWRSLRLAGVWSQAVGFVLVHCRSLASVAVKMFSHLIYCHKRFINFVLSMLFAKIMVQ